MPQPLSRVRANAQVTMSPDALIGKPDLAILVTRIFALWATIEQELAVLLVRLLKAEEGPALAIFSVLTSEGLQNLALNAAAKAVLVDDEHEIFSAVLNVAMTAGKLRHKLAHWRWGSCPELPNALLLADPQEIKRLQKKQIKLSQANIVELLRSESLSEFAEGQFLDHNAVLVYSAADLESHRADMAQASEVVLNYANYLTPLISDQTIADMNAGNLAVGAPPLTLDLGTRAGSLRQLSSLRLFQEARDRIRQGKNSSQ